MPPKRFSIAPPKADRLECSILESRQENPIAPNARGRPARWRIDLPKKIGGGSELDRRFVRFRDAGTIWTAELRPSHRRIGAVHTKQSQQKQAAGELKWNRNDFHDDQQERVLLGRTVNAAGMKTYREDGGFVHAIRTSDCETAGLARPCSFMIQRHGRNYGDE